MTQQAQQVRFTSAKLWRNKLYYPAVSIETGVGTTGYLKSIPAILAAGSNLGPTHMGTDARCKFVEMLDSGRFRIGSDGTSNVGYPTTAGCRVRIPNIIWMNATAAAAW